MATVLIANDLLETIACYDASGSQIRDRLRRAVAVAKTVNGELQVTLADWNATPEQVVSKQPAPVLRRAIWTEEFAVNRQIALAQSDGICPYCLKPIQGRPHVDHMIPRSRGGTDHIDNLCVTCRKCNESKGAKTTREFFEWLGVKR